MIKSLNIMIITGSKTFSLALFKLVQPKSNKKKIIPGIMLYLSLSEPQLAFFSIKFLWVVLLGHMLKKQPYLIGRTVPMEYELSDDQSQ